MMERFFLYHYGHVCLILIGVFFLLGVLIVRPNLARPEYFLPKYGQRGAAWAKKHQFKINMVSYAIILGFLIGGIVLIWEQLLDIPDYVSGNFETVSGVVCKTRSDGHAITFEDGETYIVDLKGLGQGDYATLRYLPHSHRASILEINGKEVKY